MKTPIRLLCAVILLAGLAACAPNLSPGQTGPTTAPTRTPLSLPTQPVLITPAAVGTVEVSEGRGPGDPTPTTEAAATPDTSTDTPTITLNENNTTLQLKTGQRFLLKLGEIYDWNLVVADQSVVSRVKNVTMVRGAQGIFEALKPGQSEVSAMGDPLCRSQKPACGMPSILFRLTVVVE